MTYTVNSFDICTNGNERFRSNSEFILVATVHEGIASGQIADDFKQQIRSYEHPEGFDLEACDRAIEHFCQDTLDANAVKLFSGIEGPVNDEGVNLYVYMTGPGYEEQQ